MARGRPATPLGSHGEISEPTQLENGKWRVRTYLRLFNGKTVQVTATGATKSAAKRQLEERCQQRLQGTDTTTLATTSTLQKLLDEWLPSHDVSDRTREIYEQNIRLHIAPALGEIRLNELSTPTLQIFLNSLSPATGKTARAVLGAAASMAVRWGVMPHNPVRDTRLPKRVRQEVNALSDQDMDQYRKQLKAWCAGNQAGPARGEGLLEIMDVVRGTGARIGEVLALRWQDVDLQSSTITITGTTNEKGGRKDFPKTGLSRRTIPLGIHAVDALHRQHAKPYREHLGEPVFPTRTGTYRTVRNTETRLRAARGDLTIAPHDFRKTVATRIESKFGLLAASRHLGHASTAVTEQAYLAAPDIVPDYTSAFELSEVTKKSPSIRENKLENLQQDDT